jgi:hypothetical protein
MSGSTGCGHACRVWVILGLGPHTQLLVVLLAAGPRHFAEQVLLIKIKAPPPICRLRATLEWKPISIAPFDRDLELAVIDRDGPHALVFPCRRILGVWVK